MSFAWCCICQSYRVHRAQCDFPNDALPGPVHCWLNKNGMAVGTEAYMRYALMVECVQGVCRTFSALPRVLHLILWYTVSIVGKVSNSSNASEYPTGGHSDSSQRTVTKSARTVKNLSIFLLYHEYYLHLIL